MPVREVGVLLLQVAGVGQQDFTKVDSRRRRQYRPDETALYQQRQIARMVDMGMRENDGFNAARIDRQRRPVLETQRFEALKQAAVDQNSTLAVVEQIF